MDVCRVTGCRFGPVSGLILNSYRIYQPTRAGNLPIPAKPPVNRWDATLDETESSNYKELRNLVDTVSEEAKARMMSDCEFFLFTDNSTA